MRLLIDIEWQHHFMVLLWPSAYPALETEQKKPHSQIKKASCKRRLELIL